MLNVTCFLRSKLSSSYAGRNLAAWLRYMQRWVAASIRATQSRISGSALAKSDLRPETEVPILGRNVVRRILAFVIDNYVLKLIDRAAAGFAFTGGQVFRMPGDEPTSGHGEHIIPRWMQRRFDLFNETLTLINGTRIPYRQLTIPCCESCNNGFCATSETRYRVSGASRFPRYRCAYCSGQVALQSFRRPSMVKRTRAFCLDRRDSSKGTILSPDFLEEFQHAQFICRARANERYFIHCTVAIPLAFLCSRIEPDDEFRNFQDLLNKPLRSIDSSCRF